MEALIRNPFHRSNPYLIPQKFYSHDNLRYSRADLDSSAYKSLEKYARDSQPQTQHPNPSYRNTNNNSLYGSRFESNPPNPLKRKCINNIQNPFFRKHLIPINNDPQPSIESQPLPQPRKQNPFVSYASKEPQIPYCNNYITPSIKHVEQEKENKPKYLSSELKIKLKSQAEIPNQISAQQITSASKPALITLGRVQQSFECPSNSYRYSIDSNAVGRASAIPTRIQFKGKTFYLQFIA